MGRKDRFRQVVILAEKSRYFLTSAEGIAADDVNLRPVACRQHDRLGRGWTQRERLYCGAKIAAREVEPLSQLDRRSPMTYAQEDDLHLSKVRRSKFKVGEVSWKRAPAVSITTGILQTYFLTLTFKLLTCQAH